MAKGKFERTKTTIWVGTIGHLDHRKMAVTAAITSILSKKFVGGHSGIDEEGLRLEPAEQNKSLNEIEQDIGKFNNEHYIE